MHRKIFYATKTREGYNLDTSKSIGHFREGNKGVLILVDETQGY